MRHGELGRTWHHSDTGVRHQMASTTASGLKLCVKGVSVHHDWRTHGADMTGKYWDPLGRGAAASCTFTSFSKAPEQL